MRQPMRICIKRSRGLLLVLTDPCSGTAFVRISSEADGDCRSTRFTSAPAAYYSSASYAGLVTYEPSLSKWLPPFMPPRISVSARTIAVNSGFAYFIFFTSFPIGCRAVSLLTALQLPVAIQLPAPTTDLVFMEVRIAGTRPFESAPAKHYSSASYAGLVMKPPSLSGLVPTFGRLPHTAVAAGPMGVTSGLAYLILSSPPSCPDVHFSTC